MARRRRTIEHTGSWLRVPYDGDPNARLAIQVDGGVPKAAFFDRDEAGGWAQARVPVSGRHDVTLLVGGQVATRESVTL